jgi:hypothetical protein
VNTSRPAAAFAVLATYAALTAASASTASAQMPGLPVLQNAFGNSGITVGVNAGTAPEGQAYALAAGWGRGRILAGGGIGMSSAAGSNGVGFGARLAMPVWSMARGSIGFAAFAGAGGTVAGERNITQLPIGVSAGWRRALGSTRGFSVYLAPHYQWVRESRPDSGTVSGGRFRGALGLDVGITPRLGVTLGIEGGQGRVKGIGSEGTSAAIGASWIWQRK